MSVDQSGGLRMEIGCGPVWTEFDDVVVLAVVFFVLLSRSTGFQIFGNLKDIFH